LIDLACCESCWGPHLFSAVDSSRGIAVNVSRPSRPGYPLLLLMVAELVGKSAASPLAVWIVPMPLVGRGNNVPTMLAVDVHRLTLRLILQSLAPHLPKLWTDLKNLLLGQTPTAYVNTCSTLLEVLSSGSLSLPLRVLSW
jgi:hypothetical protein